ncbi:hypothetical protein CCH79_00020703, partial [Gambusia affinis]
MMNLMKKPGRQVRRGSDEDTVYKVEVDSGMKFVTLPCKTIVRLPKAVTVTWRNNTSRLVHHQGCDKKLEEQHKQYKDRTEMKGNFQFGDFSLILKNPTDRDTDTYTCTISDRWGKVLIKKQVLLYVEVQQVEVKAQEGEESAVLPCKTAAHVEEDDTVEWTRTEPEFMIAYVYQNGSNKAKEQDKFYYKRTIMNKEQVKSGDLSLILKYPTERDSGVYICTFYRKSDVVRQKVILHFVK